MAPPLFGGSDSTVPLPIDDAPPPPGPRTDAAGNKLSLAGILGRFLPLVVLVGSMWAIQLVNLSGWLNPVLGLRSRDVASLPDVLTFPLVHGGMWHLMSNTAPLLLLGFLISWEGAKAFIQTTLVIVVIAGGALWLLGPSRTLVVGASGLVFGYVTFMVARAVFAPPSYRKIGYIVLAVLVGLLYGATLVWGITPLVRSGVSWQAHLTGAFSGVAAAYLLHRQRDPKQLSR